MKKKSIFPRVLLFVTSLSLLNATYANDQSLQQRIINKGVITVGTEGTYAPFTYHDENGKLTGYDVEVTRAVAKKLGVTIEFKETQWDAMLSGLNSGRFDLVANQVGLTSPERQAKYDGTMPYSFSGAVVLARQNSGITSWKQLKGLTSAQSLTSNYTDIAKEHGASVVGVDGLAQALQLVIQKRVDVTVNDKLAVLDFLQKQPHANVSIVLQADKKSSSGFVFRKGHAETIELFNDALKELQSDGTLKRLSEQFFGEDVSVR